MNAISLSAIEHCLSERSYLMKDLGLMKDKLRGKIMTEFVALRPKTYTYLMDDDNTAKKSKGTKKCVIKGILKFNDYKKCLMNNNKSY